MFPTLWLSPPSSEPSHTTEVLSVVKAGAGCPDAEALGKRVAALTGASEARVGNSKKRAQISYLRTRNGWNVEVTVLDAAKAVAGVRRLASTSPECSSLAEPLSLILSLLLQEQAASAEPTRVPDAPVAFQAPSDSWHLETGLTFGMAFGSQPSVSWGPSLGVWMHAPRMFSVVARGSWFLEQHQQTEGKGFAVGYASLFVGACAGWETHRITMPFCIGPEGARVHARGFGYSQSLESTKYLSGLGASVGAHWQESEWLSFGGDLLAGLPFQRYQLASEPASTQARLLYQRKMLSASAFLGLSVSWF